MMRSACLAFVLVAGSSGLAPMWMARAETDPAAHASLNPLASLDPGTFKSFIEAPLFDPTRRLPPVAPPPPPPPPAAPRAVVEAPPPSIHLLGIIQGQQDIAVIQRDGSQKTEMVSTGDRLDDWTVKILPEVGIEIRNGDRVSTFTMFNPGAVGAKAPEDPMAPPPL